MTHRSRVSTRTGPERESRPLFRQCICLFTVRLLEPTVLTTTSVSTHNTLRNQSLGASETSLPLPRWSSLFSSSSSTHFVDVPSYETYLPSRLPLRVSGSPGRTLLVQELRPMSFATTLLCPDVPNPNLLYTETPSRSVVVLTKVDVPCLLRLC